DVYGDLRRSPTFPLSSWYDPDRQSVSAFWPHGYVSLGEFYGERWTYWNVAMPFNRDLPGDGKGMYPSLSAYIDDGVGLLVDALIGGDLFSEMESALGPLIRCLGPIGRGLEHGLEAVHVAAHPTPREIATQKFQARVGRDAPVRIRAATQA